MPHAVCSNACASHAPQYANAGMRNLFVIATPATRKNNVLVRPPRSRRFSPFCSLRGRYCTCRVPPRSYTGVKDLAIPSSIHDFSLFPSRLNRKLIKLLMANSRDSCRGTLMLLSSHLFLSLFVWRLICL